jgi:hypothetical protein
MWVLKMIMKEPSEKELKEAREFIKKLLADPNEFEKWANRVVEGWLKRKHYRRGSVVT